MKGVYSRLSNELKEEIGKNTIQIRTGDEVKVMRGEFKGETGEIEDIDRSDQRVMVRGIEKEKPDGTKYKFPVHASNLKVISLSNKEERIG